MKRASAFFLLFASGLLFFAFGVALAQETPNQKAVPRREFRFFFPLGARTKTVTPPRREILQVIEKLICPFAVKPVPLGFAPAAEQCAIDGTVNSDDTITVKWACSYQECVIDKNGVRFLTVKGSNPFDFASANIGRGFAVLPIDVFPKDTADPTARFTIKESHGICSKEWAYQGNISGEPRKPAPTLAATGQPDLTQAVVSWFRNNDSTSVKGERLDKDQRGRIYFKDVGRDGSIRLRVALLADDHPLIKGAEKFKLQYVLTPRVVDGSFGYSNQNTECPNLPDSAYRDIAEIGPVITFFDNPATANGLIPQPSLNDPAAFLDAIPQTYVERNPFTANNTDVPAGGYALFDFALEILSLQPKPSDVSRFQAAHPEFYGSDAALVRPRTKNEACFRIAKGDGSSLAGYSQNYPSIAE